LSDDIYTRRKDLQVGGRYARCSNPHEGEEAILGLVSTMSTLGVEVSYIFLEREDTIGTLVNNVYMYCKSPDWRI
jgi:hypothetical protein